MWLTAEVTLAHSRNVSLKEDRRTLSLDPQSSSSQLYLRQIHNMQLYLGAE